MTADVILVGILPVGFILKSACIGGGGGSGRRVVAAINVRCFFHNDLVHKS